MELVPAEPGLSTITPRPDEEPLKLGREWFHANGLRKDSRIMQISRLHVSLAHDADRGELVLRRHGENLVRVNGEVVPRNGAEGCLLVEGAQVCLLDRDLVFSVRCRTVAGGAPDPTDPERPAKRARAAPPPPPPPPPPLGFQLNPVVWHGESLDREGCVSLRDVVAAERDRAAGVAPEWVVLMNFKCDVRYLMREWPELAAVPRIVFYHGREDVLRLRGELPPQCECVHLDPSALRWWRRPREERGRLVPGEAAAPIAYGTHHTKAFLLGYASGVRVAVSTANLLAHNWEAKTNGHWVQEFPFKRGAAAAGPSPFERDLAEYVATLDERARAWPGAAGDRLRGAPASLAALVALYDFSAAGCRLVTSAPGYHRGARAGAFGMAKLRGLLGTERFAGGRFAAADGGGLVAQFSSLGSFADPDVLAALEDGLCSGLDARTGRALGRAPVRKVWPTRAEVRDSVEGYPGGGSLCGDRKNVERLPRRDLHRWSESGGRARRPRGRARALPHIKTFCRHDASGHRLAWVLLTSHNLSGAAWGVRFRATEECYFVRSWEMGVLFLPSLARGARGASAFAVVGPPAPPRPSAGPSAPAEEEEEEEGVFVTTAAPADCGRHASVAFPLPYAVPPEPYRAGDAPWLRDGDYSDDPDRFGRATAGYDGRDYLMEA